MDNEPLTAAAFAGDLESVLELLAAGNDINGMGRVWNPLHAAVENEQTEVVQILLEAGADPNLVCYGMTPLHHAVDTERDVHTQMNRKGSPETVLIPLLVEAGADIHAVDNKGQTPLNWAVQTSHKHAAEYLRNQGAN